MGLIRKFIQLTQLAGNCGKDKRWCPRELCSPSIAWRFLLRNVCPARNYTFHLPEFWPKECETNWWCQFQPRQVESIIEVFILSLILSTIYWCPEWSPEITCWIWQSLCVSLGSSMTASNKLCPYLKTLCQTGMPWLTFISELLFY